MFRPSARVALLALAACGFLTGGTAPSRADSYPSHAIRAIVPFPTGGGIDSVTRILQPKMQEILGQPFVVENRPGASAIVGTEFVAKAPADGYTLLFTLNPYIVNAFLYKQLPYDPMRDFAPISLVATTPNVLAVNSSVKANSVKDLIALAKAQPGALNYGTAGVGSPFHLAGALFDVMAGVNIVAVPYPGGPQATLGLLSDQVQVMFGNLFNIMPYVKSGQLRVLAVTSAKRLAIMPDLPTIAESGVPGYEFNSWFGAMAPANTPPEIVQRLYAAIRQTIELPTIEKQLADQGAEIVGDTPAEFTDFLHQEMMKWGRVISQSGLQPK